MTMKSLPIPEYAHLTYIVRGSNSASMTPGFTRFDSTQTNKSDANGYVAMQLNPNRQSNWRSSEDRDTST